MSNETWRWGTEIELVAAFDLTPLLEHWEAQTGVLRNSVDEGRHTLWLQLVPTETDLDDAVQRYVAMVEALPPELRLLWDKSLDRCLNTGIQAGLTPPAYALVVSAESIGCEARVSLRHQFTVYAAQAKRRRAAKR